MAGLTIKCPKCRKPIIIRTSMDVTETSRKAWGYCLECEIKGVIVAEFQNISRNCITGTIGQFARLRNRRQ